MLKVSTLARIKHEGGGMFSVAAVCGGPGHDWLELEGEPREFWSVDHKDRETWKALAEKGQPVHMTLSTEPVG